MVSPRTAWSAQRKPTWRSPGPALFYEFLFPLLDQSRSTRINQDQPGPIRSTGISQCQLGSIEISLLISIFFVLRHLQSGRNSKAGATPKRAQLRNACNSEARATPKRAQLQSGRNSKAGATPKRAQLRSARNSEAGATPKRAQLQSVRNSETRATPERAQLQSARNS